MIRSDSANGAHIGQACLLCRNPNDIIDTEVSIPYEGVLAICTRCVRDMALCAGYDLERTSADWDALTVGKEESDYIADSLLEATDALVGTLTGLRRKHGQRLRNFRKRVEARQKSDG